MYLFFILSGIVLTLPTISTPHFSWRRYYPRRLVRLYVPVLAAVAFGALTIAIVGRLNSPELGAWVVARPDQYDLPSLAQDATLIFGTSRVVSPLWSLQFEVLFSLLLPLYVILSARAQRWWWVKLAVVLALIVVGSVAGNPALFYLPMFAIGSLLAARWGWVAERFSALLERTWMGPALLGAAIVLTCIRWEVSAFGIAYVETAALGILSVVGVGMLVLLGALWRPFRTLLERPLLIWLGAMSFSLYLVHEPILLAFRFLTAELNPLVGIAVAVPVSFGVAMLFLRWVERPSHRLAQRMGRPSAAVAAAPEPTVEVVRSGR